MWRGRVVGRAEGGGGKQSFSKAISVE